MRLLLDTNIFLEVILEQDSADQAQKVLSMGAVVAEQAKQFQLDFDDAYQYVAAELNALRIVSFDADFDRTELGRIIPAGL